MNHATYAVIDNDRNLAKVPGRRNQNFSLWNFGDEGGFSFSSFPPFHVCSSSLRAVAQRQYHMIGIGSNTAEGYLIVLLPY